ncbi:unnamed protein product, partial [Arabidopsis halleri]
PRFASPVIGASCHGCERAPGSPLTGVGLSGTFQRARRLHHHGVLAPFHGCLRTATVWSESPSVFSAARRLASKALPLDCFPGGARVLFMASGLQISASFWRAADLPLVGGSTVLFGSVQCLVSFCSPSSIACHSSSICVFAPAL